MINFKKLSINALQFVGAMAFFVGVNAQAAEDFIPDVIEIAAPVKAIFAPKGFDSNDNSEIVIAGAYPNSCYKVGPTQVTINNETKTVEVEARAYFTNSSYCLMVYIPYTQVISLGILKKGDYSIEVNHKLNATLPVSLAGSDRLDDHMYATITSLSRKTVNTFQLQGYLPSTCAYLEEVRVIHEEGNVLAVLPIIKMTKDCEAADGVNELDFSVDFTIDPTIHGQKLIHVRSLNGASVNQVVEL